MILYVLFTFAGAVVGASVGTTLTVLLVLIGILVCVATPFICQRKKFAALHRMSGGQLVQFPSLTYEAGRNYYVGHTYIA